jgi:flavin reductase (DIM6/NTAB) family NADH-FMN oxidoreductase RutF
MPTKIVKKPFVALRPVPVVLVSCGHGERANIVTIAWTGILCSNPPQVGIGVRPDRHSHGLIQETGDFVSTSLVKSCSTRWSTVALSRAGMRTSSPVED